MKSHGSLLALRNDRKINLRQEKEKKERKKKARSTYLLYKNLHLKVLYLLSKAESPSIGLFGRVARKSRLGLLSLRVSENFWGESESFS